MATTTESINFADKSQIFLDRKYRYSKSFATRRTYQAAIEKFDKFLVSKYNTRLSDTLAQFYSNIIDPIEALDEFYTYLTQYKLRNGKVGYSNSTISLFIVAIKEFLNSLNLHIYAEDLKQKFRLPRKETVFEEGLTKEKIVRILRNSAPKLQTAILLSASSSMRIGELVQLKISDINFGTNPTTISLRRETTKTRQPRFTHITSEATKSLKDYLRRTQGWTENSLSDMYIFLPNDRDYTDASVYNRAVRSACTALQQSLLSVVRSIPELFQKNENGRYSIHFHAFRAWFKTQVTNAHESDFAEVLMGHKSTKTIYYRNNPQAELKTYLKVESALTVSDLTAMENTVEGLQEQVWILTIELEKQKQRLEIAEKYEKVNRN